MLKSAKPLNLLDRSLPARTIIWALAWPTILEQFLQVTVTYVDSAMVGSLGAQATAAVSVPASTIWLVNGWMNAFAIGFAVLMARNLGSGKTDRARLITRQAILSSLFWNIPDIHLSYHCKAASLLDRSRGISKTISATILSLHRLGVFSKPAYDSHQPSVETLEPRSISMA